jgi:hypothetical protein
MKSTTAALLLLPHKVAASLVHPPFEATSYQSQKREAGERTQTPSSRGTALPFCMPAHAFRKKKRLLQRKQAAGASAHYIG